MLYGRHLAWTAGIWQAWQQLRVSVVAQRLFSWLQAAAKLNQARIELLLFPAGGGLAQALFGGGGPWNLVTGRGGEGS